MVADELRHCGGGDSGLLFRAGIANGTRFFAQPYWKIDPISIALSGISIMG